MKKLLLSLNLILFSFLAWGQKVTTNPEFPQADEQVTFTIDATGTTLEGYDGDVWIWAWIPDCNTDGDCDAPTNVNPATAAQSDAKMTSIGSNIYTITFTPTTFFGQSKDDIPMMGLKLKSVDWNDGIQTDNDIFVEFTDGGLQVAFTAPSKSFLLVDSEGTIDIKTTASKASTITLTVGGVEVTSATGTTSLDFTLDAETTGKHVVTVKADDGSETVEQSFYYVVREATVEESKPASILKGINYLDDATKVALALEAPNKSSVYVVGDFNNWEIDPDYQMKKDGEIFWLEIDGLTSGTEYIFQYLVDETIQVADPYSDQLSDPDDNQIDETTFPGLIAYPDNDFISGIASVMQTGQTPYPWEVTDFQRPAKEELVIYELLVRDFDEAHSYDAVIKRLDYLEKMGINAIELLPVNEFNNNVSWGYDPSFLFAPDKYYGPKNELKRFVDECHKRGIAVILDIVYNHTHEDSPLAQLYWNSSDFKPAADNPWLNEDAPHQVLTFFFDFNHESTYTKAYIDSVNAYWLQEYNIDGYRFDLTKGFTQKETTGFGDWGAKDQSRIDILTRMTDEIWEKEKDAYVIFEHLSDNDEEKILADYGIMMWGNMNHNFSQLVEGQSSSLNVDWAYYVTRGWNEPNLIAYMESHDEERLIFNSLQSGNSAGAHSARILSTALDRAASAAAVYFAIPGPKMIWQFGELGYDISINENGRTGEKPIPWAEAEDELAYEEDVDRINLYETYQALVNLKTSYDIFNTTNFKLVGDDTSLKEISLLQDEVKDSPASADEMNIHLVANFDVISKTVSSTFPHAGTWYDYFDSNESITVTGETGSVSLRPGEFKFFIDFELDPPVFTEAVTGIGEESFRSMFNAYPNPTDGILSVSLKDAGVTTGVNFSLYDMFGRTVRVDVANSQAGVYTLDLSNLPKGIYILKAQAGNKTFTNRLVKE